MIVFDPVEKAVQRQQARLRQTLVPIGNGGKIVGKANETRQKIIQTLLNLIENLSTPLRLNRLRVSRQFLVEEMINQKNQFQLRAVLICSNGEKDRCEERTRCDEL